GRYVMGLGGSLLDRAWVKALTKRMRRLQDDLGNLKDVRTAKERIRELAPPADHNINDVGQAAGIVIGWYLRELADMEAKLCKDVRRFRKAKPFWRPAGSAATASAALRRAPTPRN